MFLFCYFEEPVAAPQKQLPESMNRKSHHARLSLARAYNRTADGAKDAEKYYNEVMIMSPEVRGWWDGVGFLARLECLDSIGHAIRNMSDLWYRALSEHLHLNQQDWTGCICRNSLRTKPVIQWYWAVVCTCFYCCNEFPHWLLGAEFSDIHLMDYEDGQVL